MIQLIAKLREAKHVAVLTGAGVSAESGIPTYRDTQTGLWEKYEIEDLATPDAFRRDPKLVWEWYLWRQEMMSACEPNPGHYALAEMAQLIPEFTLITQNIDGLHEAAGSKDLLELHGSIHRIKCFDCERVDPVVREGTPPLCTACGGMMRADVVWFGEGLPTETLQKAYIAAQSCDVFLSIGTSAQVYPAAELPLVAQDSHALLVEINPNDTSLTPYADYALKGAAGVVLPQLVEQLKL